MAQAIQSISDADAAHYMAIKAAEGAGVPQDWTAALDHLQRSAELGAGLAQAELAGLSGDWALAHDILAGKTVPASPWSRFRYAIDLAKWLEPPRSATVSEGPRQVVVRDLATPEMCDWLIERARPGLEPAMVYDNTTFEHRRVSARTNSSCMFRARRRDLVMAILRARIAAVTDTQVPAMEDPDILNYQVGQEYKPHFDTPADPKSPGFRQRMVTVLVSLNDGYEGGETAFLAIGGKWKGRKGTALCFWNVDADGALDRRTLHAGRPVTSGEKWMMSQWIGPSQKS